MAPHRGPPTRKAIISRCAEGMPCAKRATRLAEIVAATAAIAMMKPEVAATASTLGR
jgi:hypothetical protein